MPPSPAHDLVRRAAALAAQHGWTTLATISADERELRQLVLPAGAAFPVELCVRASSPDAHARARTEIEIARAGRSEHLLGLAEEVRETTRRREVRGAELVPALLLEYAAGGLLADLLAQRTYLRAGEAATVLLGVAAGLSALNERGWAHGAVTTRCVVFRHDSCPALASLSGARRLTDDAHDADRRGFLRLTERLAGSLPRSDGDRMLEAIREPLRSGGWEAVGDAVAVAAEPEAVFIPVGNADIAAADPLPSRILTSRGEPGAHGGVLATVLEGHPIAALARQLTGWIGRRRKLVAVAVAPIALAAAALALVPADASTSGAEPTATASAPATTPSARAERSPAPSGSAAPQGGDPRLRSDDPVVAADALLSARLACFQTGADASCLETLLRADSALHREDAAALGSDGAAELRDFSGATLALVQRWGDAALVSATRPTAGEGAGATAPGAHSEPASILLVRNEAGWRLRDVYRD